MTRRCVTPVSLVVNSSAKCDVAVIFDPASYFSSNSITTRSASMSLEMFARVMRPSLVRIVTKSFFCSVRPLGFRNGSNEAW